MANYPNYMQGAGAYQAPQQSWYPPMYQQYPPMQQQAPVISGRMVTSLEEARGVQVDFTSGITVCPDMGHDVIYVKVFDRNTGAAPIAEYRRVGSSEDGRMDRMQKQLDEIMALLQESPKGKHAQKGVSEDV